MDDKNFNKDTLEEIVNYYQLKSLLSKKLNRVVQTLKLFGISQIGIGIILCLFEELKFNKI